MDYRHERFRAGRLGVFRAMTKKARRRIQRPVSIRKTLLHLLESRHEFKGPVGKWVLFVVAEQIRAVFLQHVEHLPGEFANFRLREGRTALLEEVPQRPSVRCDEDLGLDRKSVV